MSFLPIFICAVLAPKSIYPIQARAAARSTSDSTANYAKTWRKRAADSWKTNYPVRPMAPSTQSSEPVKPVQRIESLNVKFRGSAKGQINRLSAKCSNITNN